MRIKEGVSLQGLDIKMRPVLVQAARIWRNLGKELVVTSGLEGTHSAGSLHYYGFALDFRSNYFSAATKRTAARWLRNQLGKDFDVVSERTHIHVEYDPKVSTGKVSPVVAAHAANETMKLRPPKYW